MRRLNVVPLNQIFSLIAPYITRCPHSQPELVASTGVSVQPPNAPSGTPVTFSFVHSPNTTYYAHFQQGVNSAGTSTQTVQLSPDLGAIVPSNPVFTGLYYVSIVSFPRLFLF